MAQAILLTEIYHKMMNGIFIVLVALVGKYEGLSYVFFSKIDEPKLLRLEKKGIIFEHQMIKNNELVNKKQTCQKKILVDFETKNEINKLINQANRKSKTKLQKEIKNTNQ